MKVNFTKENENELRSLIADSVLSKNVYGGPLGQEYNVFDLVASLSINSLRTLMSYIQTQLVKLNNSDDWIENPNAEVVAELEKKKRTINLIIGWKLYNEELKENQKEKARLEKQLAELIESQKSPSELIAELQAKIAEL